MKILKHVTFLLLVSAICSCSVAESSSDYSIEEETASTSRILTMADLTTTIIDGKIINDQRVIDVHMDNAFATHFNYIDKEIVISTTEAEHDKYLNTNPKIKNSIERARSEPINIETNDLPLMSHKDILDSPLKFNKAYEPTDSQKEAFYESLSNIGNHADTATFLFESTSEYKFLTEVNNMPDTGSVPSHLVFSSGVYDVNVIVSNVFDIIGESNTHMSGHLKTNSNSYHFVFFFSGPNYTGTYTYVSLPGESIIELTKPITHPGNIAAQSVYVWRF
ncbi:MAG: hypothetical protein ACI9Y7_001562 [Dokdonia sp.]|jgi:hypothetical protein